MGVRGPAPKDPAIRQRMNKSSTKKALTTDAKPKRVPPLPTANTGWEWHVRTRGWWRELWRSPMAGELLTMDRQAIERLAFVVAHAHWCPGDARLEEQIQKLSQPYGLTPLDRRRLEWSIEEPKAATAAASAATVEAGPDPRSLLRVV